MVREGCVVFAIAFVEDHLSKRVKVVEDQVVVVALVVLKWVYDVAEVFAFFSAACVAL